MENNQIKTTNLMLLRKILEGQDNEILCNFNCANVELHNNIRKEIKENNKLKNKTKRRKLLDKKESKFYLSGDDDYIKNWLKQKRKADRQKKIEMTKLRNEEKLKNNLNEKENEDRLMKARISYDNWLKELRNRNIKKTLKENQEIPNIVDKMKISEEAYNKWFLNKQIQESQKNLKNIDKNISQIKKVKFIDKTSAQIEEIKKINTTKNCQSNINLSKPSKKKLIDEKLDEDYKNIINKLRTTKLKDKENSKKRVYSGILFKREKTDKNILPLKTDDNWNLAIEEFGDKNPIVDELLKSDSRSRKVDQISHHHDNPFIDRSDFFQQKNI